MLTTPPPPPPPPVPPPPNEILEGTFGADFSTLRWAEGANTLRERDPIVPKGIAPEYKEVEEGMDEEVVVIAAVAEELEDDEDDDTVAASWLLSLVILRDDNCLSTREACVIGLLMPVFPKVRDDTDVGCSYTAVPNLLKLPPTLDVESDRLEPCLEPRPMMTFKERELLSADLRVGDGGDVTI